MKHLHNIFSPWKVGGLLLILGFFYGNTLLAQTYPYFPYANNSIGQIYVMPGDSVTDTTALIQSVNGFINPYEFDRAVNANVAIPAGDSSAYLDFLADSGLVFGITDGGNNDAGGQNKRYTSTKFPNGVNTKVAALRWNGGWNGSRRSGKWGLYTLDFPAGNYQFVYRFNDVNAASHSMHKLRVTVFNTTNMADTLIDYVIDLTDDGTGAFRTAHMPGDTVDNVIYIGGSSSMNSGYAKGLPVLSIPTSGNYVLRLEELIPGVGMFATFTFNSAAGTLPPPPPADSTYDYFPFANQTIGQVHMMPGTKVVDTTGFIQGVDGFVNPIEFDRAVNANIAIPAGDSSAYLDFLADSGLVVGITDNGNDAGGLALRYTSNKFPNGVNTKTAALRWNGGWNGYRRSGKWAHYTLAFPEGDYQFVYRFRDDNGSSHSLHKLRVTVFDVMNTTDTLMDYTIDLSDDGAGAFNAAHMPGDTVDNVIYIGGNDSINSGYAKGLPVLTIPTAGNYVLRLEELATGQGMFSTFTFNTTTDSMPPPPPPTDTLYAYFPYAGLSIGNKHMMPGGLISDTTGNDDPALVNPWEFDRAVNADIMIPAGDSTAYLDYLADSAAVFGITDNGNDAGGGVKRGYVSTKFPNGANAKSAPIRWNNGWNGWRRTGKWAYYTMNFPEGNYQFVYRARVDGGTSFSQHGLRLTLFPVTNVTDTIADITVDLSDDGAGSLKDLFAPGDTIDNVIYIGGGDSTNFGYSRFFRVVDVITIPTAGDYVFRYEETIPGAGQFGNFTFNAEVMADTTGGDTTISIGDMRPENLLQMYSYDNKVVIAFSERVNATISIANIHGQLLMSKEFSGAKFEEEVPVADGVYLLMVETADGYAVRKIHLHDQ